MRREADSGTGKVASGHVSRQITLLLALMAMVLFACSGVAFAKVITGTDGRDMLVGTPNHDRITGGAANDTTTGKGGDDVYRYADGWGRDVLYDTAGIDTLDFRATTTGVSARLCSETNGTPYGGQAEVVQSDGPPSRVVFDSDVAPGLSRDSNIENARGGSGNDYLLGCSLSNKLTSGRGNNVLVDVGGRTDWGIPASNDTYLVNRSSNTTVADFGGDADVVRMRGLTSEQVRMERIDFNNDGQANSLLITNDDPATGESYRTVLSSQFGHDDYNEIPDEVHVDNRIESLVFKDKTIDPSTVGLGEASATAAQEAASVLRGATLEGSGS